MRPISEIIFLFLSTYLPLSNGYDLDTMPQVLFLGCYSTKFEHSEIKYKIKTPVFAWETCMLLCSAKETQYAGTQKRSGFCFCSNYLLQLSSEVDPFLCSDQCYGDLTRSCGGQEAMTVYSLKNNTAPAFLMMTTQGISHTKDSSFSILAPIFIESRFPSGLNYHYKRNEIYFLANQKLYRTRYEYSLNRYGYPKVIVPQAEKVTCFTIDWIQDKLYLGHWRPDNNEGHVLVANLDGSKMAVTKILQNVIKIEIDPFSRKLIMLTANIHKSRGSIVIYDLDNNTDITLKTVGQDLTIDTLAKKAYLISGNKLLQISYLASKSTIQVDNFLTYNRRGMNTLMALYGEVMYSQLVNDFNQEIYNIKTWATKLEPIRILSTEQKYLLAMRIFHEIAQIPDEEYQCKKKMCSHQCDHRILIQVKCTCPNYMFLNLDGKTCIGNTPNDLKVIEPSEDQKKVSNSITDSVSDLEWRDIALKSGNVKFPSLKNKNTFNQTKSLSRGKNKNITRKRKVKLQGNGLVPTQNPMQLKLFPPNNVTEKKLPTYD